MAKAFCCQNRGISSAGRWSTARMPTLPTNACISPTNACISPSMHSSLPKRLPHGPRSWPPLNGARDAPTCGRHRTENDGTPAV